MRHGSQRCPTVRDDSLATPAASAAGNSFSLPNTPNGTKLTFAELQAIAAADTTSNQLLDVLNQRFMHGTMSAQMRSSILTATNAVASTNPLARAQAAVYLVVTSSQYQVQR